MSQNQSSKEELQASNGMVTHAEPVSVQIGLRLRATDRSDRAIVSNVTAVVPSAGMVFLDFGFLEQQAIDQISKAAQAGTQTPITLDGRLESRIAMTMDNAAQLSRQLELVLASTRKSRPSPIDIEPLMTGSDTTLQ